MQITDYRLIYRLRKATDNDFQLAYDIRKNALGKYVEQTWGWDEQWQMKYHKEDFDADILQIIEVEGKSAGSVEIIFENDITTVSGIYITGEFQNKGIGESVMRNIIDKTQGKVRLQVLKVNHRAKKFYERLGFSTWDENETHFKMEFIKN